MDIPKSFLEGKIKKRISKANKKEKCDHFDRLDKKDIIDIKPEDIEVLSSEPTTTSVDEARAKFEKQVLNNFQNRVKKDLAKTFNNEKLLSDQWKPEEHLVVQFKTCMVCSLPRRLLEQLEHELLVDQQTYNVVANKYDMPHYDLENHVRDCILDRKVAVPAGSLVNSLVYEINEFIQRMIYFRSKVDSSMSNESITTYLNVIGELRTAVKEVISIDSPADNAILVIKNVFNPLITSIIRELARELDVALEELIQFTLPGKQNEVRKIFKKFVKQTAEAYGERLQVSILRYAELQGIDPEVVLGNPNEENKKRK